MRSSIFVTSAFVLAAVAQSLPNDPSSSACDSQCKIFQSGCSPTSAQINPADLTKCICSDSDWKNVISCFQCAANQLGAASDYQATADALSQQCKSAGHSVPSATITGSGVGLAPTGGTSPAGSSSSAASPTSGSGGSGTGAAVGTTPVPTAFVGALFFGLGFVVML